MQRFPVAVASARLYGRSGGSGVSEGSSDGRPRLLRDLMAWLDAELGQPADKIGVFRICVL